MINYRQDDFFNHNFKINRLNIGTQSYILNTFVNKSILHIGCVDSLCYNKEHNLHIKLSSISKSLHGFDIDKNGIDILNEDCPSVYFTDLNNVYNELYDIVLIPEVIEHVDNLGDFINNMAKINTKEYFITAPDISLYNTNISGIGDNIHEAVHSDHKCWFSPYTLYNVCKPLISKITLKDTCDMFLLNGSIAIHIK